MLIRRAPARHSTADRLAQARPGADPQLALVAGHRQGDRGAEGLEFKLALIHAEQDKAYLRQKLREGRIKPL